MNGRAQTIYVTYDEANEIEMFNAATGADLGTFANTGLSIPEALAFNSAGDLFVANYGNSTIEEFTPNGVGTVFAHTLTGPDAMVFDSSGNLYVADYWANTIQKFTPNGTESVFANTGLHYPTGLTIDSSGNLYAANGNTLTIEKFTPSGVGSLFANTGQYSDPLQGLACDSAGNLYLGCQAGSEGGIEKITPNGAVSIFDVNDDNFSGMVFNSSGDLIGADNFNNRIVEVTPTGDVSFGTPTRPWGIAVQSVPEPSTSGFLSLGLFSILPFWGSKQRPRSN
jgi:streptogramin lyase